MTQSSIQRKRNIRLLIILTVLISATVVVYFLSDPQERISVSQDQFAYAIPEEINEVVFELPEETVNLSFSNGQWIVNETYKADAQRVTVLFAILKQMKVRRKVPEVQEDSVRQLINTKGVNATFLKNGSEQTQMKVFGSELKRITYVTRGEDAPIYFAQIPGYQSYLAGIFLLDQNGWRNPLVFDINWRNLQAVKFIFPEENEKGFDITFNNDFYSIAQLDKTDSTKLVDLLDNVSLLYVNDYLNEKEMKEWDSLTREPIATIIVEDVGKNQYSLEVMSSFNNSMFVRIDSTDYAYIERSKLREVLRPRRYFEMGRSGQ